MGPNQLALKINFNKNPIMYLDYCIRIYFTHFNLNTIRKLPFITQPMSKQCFVVNGDEKLCMANKIRLHASEQLSAFPFVGSVNRKAGRVRCLIRTARAYTAMTASASVES